MPLPVQSPGPAAQLEERFAFKGGIRLQLDETIVPVEVILPRARGYAMGLATPAAAVGFRSEVSLFSQLARTAEGDTAVLVHGIWVSSAAAMTFQILRTSGFSAFTNSTQKTFLDLARGLLPQTLISFKNSAIATVAQAFWHGRVQAQATVHIDFTDNPIVLDGIGTSDIMVRPTADNTAIGVSILWSEPPAPA